MIRRIFVEKKQGFDIEASGMLQDWKENLHIAGLKAVRVINRYDMQGVDEDIFEIIRDTIFSEPPLDSVWNEHLSMETGARSFAVEFLPGQFDQRADSAVQCIQLLKIGSMPRVRFARIILLSGDISDHEFEKIKNYVINPVDSREADWEKPDRLERELREPASVPLIRGFLDLSAEKLTEFGKESGLAMSDQDLMFVKNHFIESEKREPTLTELRVIDTYWSDHCRHTTFLTEITEVRFEEGGGTERIKRAYQEYLRIRKEVYGEQERDISLMDLAVIGAKWLARNGKIPDLDQSDEINACSIKAEATVNGSSQDWLIMFKNETHNHPTEIEPFGGAATCLGGAIRDPLSGRVYVHQAMRVTGSGDPRTKVEDTLPGKLPQRQITRGAARGYSSYGNQIGLATGQVTELYDEGYLAKRMEVGAVIGAAPASHVIRKSPVCGDVVVLVGGRTGRDGCGGATGSSKEHTEESIKESSAEVQKGNPLVERNIQRLFRRKEAASLIKRCNDFGAGGVSVAVGELADSIDVDLDLVRKKYEGLDGTELAISESQERMAVVLSPADVDSFLAYAQEENLEAYAIASVTDSGRFRMYWRGVCILDLSRDFLNTNGVKQKTKVLITNKTTGNDSFGIINQSKNKQFDNLTTEPFGLNNCSQQGLLEAFDSTIGAGTVLMPLGGKNQLTPPMGMASKLPVLEGETDTVTLMSYGFDPSISKESPFFGAGYAVVDSLTKITAMGGDFTKARLSLQEYFERLGDDPKSWGKPFEALLGALEVQIALEVPAIGGKDSMSGTFLERKVPPTLISFAVGITDASRVLSPEFKQAGDRIYLIPAKKEKDGGIDFTSFKANMLIVQEQIATGNINAASTIGPGGIYSAIIKMALGNGVGAHLEHLKHLDCTTADYGSLLVTAADFIDLTSMFPEDSCLMIGRTTEDQTIQIGPAGSRTPLEVLLKKWKEPLESVFPTVVKSMEAHPLMNQIRYQERSRLKPAVSIARPRILIPVFPGTNCEIDSKRAFEKAGALTEIQMIRNLTYATLKESIDELEQSIRNSQIIMIPGGFSGGDEPDGSAKFILAVFQNPRIREAVNDLMENRDGLMLGICNGFQALIKLGLVPYGKITSGTSESPTLTYNTIGRHVSRLVRTKIVSVKSPWMAGVSLDDVHLVPVSHGEGRFIVGDGLLKQLITNGQIATQYVGQDGIPSNQIDVNPNGSVAAIEGITSPDGRVLGKMAHSERIGQYLYKNVLGETDQKIFSSGVSYFK